MAGIKPLFSSAPRIKLKINDTDVAYAIGMNLNINVDLRPVQTLGKFGAVSIEPTMYNVVSGTMQIIKLNNREKIKPSSFIPNSITPKGIAVVENGISKIKEIDTAVSETGSNSILTTNSLIDHLDPRKVLASETFDIYLYMKTGNSDTDEKPWLKITDCRIIGRNTNIAMGQLVNEPVNFQGLWATPFDEDEVAMFAADVF